jgi:radical SAM superfamily enzyme YgiQ (UPF0313 family)
MREPGRILLVACYELGHQPLAVAWPAAFLERAGYAPAVLDLSVEPLDAEKVSRARVVAISVPMHTALRLGVLAARRIRALNPAVHVCVYGLYAALNADELLADGCADSVLAGELEHDLVALVQRLEAARSGAAVAAALTAGTTRPLTTLAKLDFPVPARSALPALKKPTSKRAADASTSAATVRSRPCTGAGSSSCPWRRCWLTFASRSPPAPPT